MTTAVPVSDCAICQHPQVGFHWRTVEDKALLRCKSCGFAWFLPSQYRDDAVRQQYLGNETSPAEYYRRIEAHDAATFGVRIRLLSAMVGGRTRRILDAGCNVGTFLGVAAKNGWTPLGVEPNPEAAKKARDRGFEVHTGFFDWAAASHLGKFDVVHMGDVIEHVFDPVDMLRVAASVLKPGGVLMAVTPDLDSVMARLLQIKPAEHLVYFTKESFALAAKGAGFDEVRVQRWGRRRSIAAMPYSTTFSGIGKQLVRVVNVPGIRAAVELALFHAFKDELLLTARHPG